MTRIPLNPRSKALEDFLTGEDPKPTPRTPPLFDEPMLPEPVPIDPYVKRAIDRSRGGS